MKIQIRMKKKNGAKIRASPSTKGLGAVRKCEDFLKTYNFFNIYISFKKSNYIIH